MNHANVAQHAGLLPYAQRGFQLWLLNEQHFDELNPGGHVLGLNGYCLDALDPIPAGCMWAAGHLPAQRYVERGITLKERQDLDRLADRLIAELLAELKAEDA